MTRKTTDTKPQYVAAPGELSQVQLRYRDLLDHSVLCAECRSKSECETAQVLYRAWRDAGGPRGHRSEMVRMRNEDNGQDKTLADLRKLSGLSQLEVARRMGASPARPGQIERDFPNVRFAIVQAYIRALGGRIEFAAVGPVDVWADEIVQDPNGPRDHGDRTDVRSSAASEDPSLEEEFSDNSQGESTASRALGRRNRGRGTQFPGP